jgi:multidrug efflux pump subunit AcrB
MNLTENALKNPAAVMVVVALIALFGISSLIDIPVQLFPDIERPAMSIQTGWRAASPREIESEILEPQEEVLQGLPGVERMDGNANAGQANINLSFAIGTDMRSMLVEVIGRLNRVPPLPPDATPPVVSLGGGGGGAGANETLSWFFVQLLPGTAGPVEDYRRFVEETVKPRIESVPGVAAVRINGGPPEELQITVDPYKAADLGVMLPQIANVAGRANDVSGGFVDVGRRQYTLRFEGRYAPEELRNLILAWRDGKPVRLGDVAEVKVQRPDRNFVVVQNGNPALGIEILRESGANVLSTLSGVKAVVEEMRTGVLAERGLTIAQSFDASLFINRAISLLGSNLILGILLAVGILWWFLRNLRATLLIAVAIPVSLLSTFVVLKLTGHTLNVISLAGLAFAVGMVLDAAIVVAENILRLREGGKTPFEAAFEGTRQVKGALLASTATTVAIFLPVLFIEDVEGQLFADLALTIAIAVAISMLVAITVLPAAARGWLRAQKLSDNHAPSWRRLSGWIMAATSNQRRRVAWIVGLIALPAALTVTLMPQLDYLPPVKRAAIDAFFNFPEGTSVATVEREILPVLIERLRPYMEGEKQPQLKNYYIWLWPGGGTLGARVEDESRIGELERIVRDEIVSGFPDTRAFAFEGNLFGGFGGSSRAVLVHLQSSDMDALYAAAREGERLLREKMPGANVQVWPNPDQASPELRLRPNDQRIVEVGWSRSELGSVIRTLG